MYWQHVLNEVLNKDSNECKYRVTNLNPQKQAHSSSRSNIKFYLNKTHTGIYFTQREAQTMWFLLHGYTIKAAAQKMSLSPRTVEYYLQNMKAKLKCRTKASLIREVMSSYFLSAWQQNSESRDERGI